MFGSLFETEGEDTSNNTGTVSKLQSPSEPRGKTGICGLQNQGATCYLNSLLQTLFFTPEFRGNCLLLFFSFYRRIHCKVILCNNIAKINVHVGVQGYGTGVHSKVGKDFSTGYYKLTIITDNHYPTQKIACMNMCLSHKMYIRR